MSAELRQAVDDALQDSFILLPAWYADRVAAVDEKHSGRLSSRRPRLLRKTRPRWM